MKKLFQLLILFFCTAQVLVAQDVENIVFRFSCVPTSTTDYSIEITREQFILTRHEKIPGKNDRIKRIDSSNYTHTFNSNEKERVDSIIKVYRLDSIGLYQNRTTEWGSQWEIEIKKKSMTYKMDLPNYNNAGLELLISFITCLIPKKERPPFECKKCS